MLWLRSYDVDSAQTRITTLYRLIVNSRTVSWLLIDSVSSGAKKADLIRCQRPERLPASAAPRRFHGKRGARSHSDEYAYSIPRQYATLVP